MAIRFMSRLEDYPSDDSSDEYVPDEREGGARDLESDWSDLDGEVEQPPAKRRKGATSVVGSTSRLN